MLKVLAVQLNTCVTLGKLFTFSGYGACLCSSHFSKLRWR